MNKVSAILLAAGLSSRMQGPNKLMLPVGGKPLVLRTYEQLKASAVSEIIVVTGRDAEEIEVILSDHTPEIVHNPDFTKGMTTSVQKGVEVAQGDAFMICLADMPWLTASHYNALINRYESAQIDGNDAPIIVPQVNGIPGNPVVFSSSYRQSIMAHTDMNGCKKIVSLNLEHRVEYMMDDIAYVSDLDTPEQYRKLTQ